MTCEEHQRTKRIKMKITEIPKEVLQDLQYDLIDVKLFQRNVLDRSDFILLQSYCSNQGKVEMLMELMRSKSEEDHDNFLEVIEEDYKWLRDKCEIFLQKIRLDALINGKSSNSLSSLPSNDDKKEVLSTEENDRYIPSAERSSSCPRMSSDTIQKSPSSPDSIAIPARDNNHSNALQLKSKDEIIASSAISDDTKLMQTITSDMMTVVRRNHRVVRRWSTLAHVLGMTHIAHTLRMRMVMNGEDADACVLYLLEEWKGALAKEATLKRLIGALREESFNDVADELENTFAV